MIRASYHHHEGDTRSPPNLAVAILECKTALGSAAGNASTGVPESEDGSVFHILDMDFFDENSLVIVYRSYAREGSYQTRVFPCRTTLLIMIDTQARM